MTDQPFNHVNGSEEPPEPGRLSAALSMLTEGLRGPRWPLNAVHQCGRNAEVVVRVGSQEYASRWCLECLETRSPVESLRAALPPAASVTVRAVSCGG